MALKFETNIVNELRLRSITGELVDSQFGGQQYRFVSDAGVFYVSEPVGNILHERFQKLNVQAGEAIEITKREVVKNGRKSIQWQVARVGFAIGERGDGTFAVSTPEPPSELEKQLAASLAAVEARKAPAIAGAAAGRPVAELAAWQGALLSQTNALTDVFAAAVAHASSAHGNTVKADDVRSLMLSAFINMAKGGARSNAA
jgi:antitoxin (DNA-binding transcriptional repressor) of toxin-antitoxin stability system